MNISGGIAEISFKGYTGNIPAPKKVYLWPNYDAGSVEKIRGVVKRTESNIIYSKPLDDDRDKVLKNNLESSKQYTSTGNIQKGGLGTYPGMLFEVIA